MPARSNALPVCPGPGRVALVVLHAAPCVIDLAVPPLVHGHAARLRGEEKHVLPLAGVEPVHLDVPVVGASAGVTVVDVPPHAEALWLRLGRHPRRRDGRVSGGRHVGRGGERRPPGYVGIPRDGLLGRSAAGLCRRIGRWPLGRRRRRLRRGGRRHVGVNGTGRGLGSGFGRAEAAVVHADVPV